MLDKRSSLCGIVILIVVVSLLFGANSAFASSPSPIDNVVTWDKDTYKPGETGTFTLVSEASNKNSNLIDFAYVHLWSDSDKIGSDYLVEESGVNTGRYYGDVQFGTDTDGVESIKTNVGDLVYVGFGFSWYSAKFCVLCGKYIVVTTDKAYYSVGETVRITGEVRYPDGTLNILVYPNGLPTELKSQEVTIDADKKFILTHTAGGELIAGGTYTMEAVYRMNSWSLPYRAETTFDVSCLNALRCYPAIPIAQPPVSYEKSTQLVTKIQTLNILVISVLVAVITIGVFVIKRRK